FRYDAMPQAISSTSPTNGSSTPPGLSSLVVHFNEPYLPSTIGTDDLKTSQGIVVSYTLVDATTVQYTLRDVANEGTFAYRISAGAICDQFGHPMAASGGNLTIDVATQPLNLLENVGPDGSLIYESTIGRVNLSPFASPWPLRPDHGYEVVDTRSIGF